MVSKLTGLLTAGILMISVFNFSALGDSDQRQAVIKDLKNRVEIKYGASLWRTASLNQLVRPGTVVRTGSLAKAELMYPDGTVTRLGSRTSLTVLERNIRAVKIDSGKIWFKVAKKSVGYRIYSPTAVAAITGTEGFVQFGDTDKESTDNRRLASRDLNDAFKTAENNPNEGFSGGLVEGNMKIYKGSNDSGDLIGEPTDVGAGQIIKMIGNDFSLQDVGINSILNQNRDISTPDADANNNNNGNNDSTANNNRNNNNGNNDNVQNQSLGPTNPTTEQVPSVINKQQDINNSPTTGDLEIIIK